MEQEKFILKYWQRILLLVIPYFFVVGFFQIIGLYVSGADMINIEAAKTSWQHLIISLFSLIGTLLLLWIFIRIIDNEPFINLGFNIKNRLNDIWFGVLLGLLIMGLGYFALFSMNEIHYSNFKYNNEDIILSILVFIIIAVMEEALFRGYILRNLMCSVNKYIALVISAAIFSVMHGANPNMDWLSLLNLFLAGVLLGVSYVYTKNLWFPIALHFSWNFFQTLFGFNVSGIDSYSLIEFKIKDPNLWNGGAFGFEGSFLSVIAQVIVIILIFYYYKNPLKLNSSK